MDAKLSLRTMERVTKSKSLSMGSVDQGRSKEHIKGRGKDMRLNKFRGLDRYGNWHHGCYLESWIYDQDKIPQDIAYIQKDMKSEAIQVRPETVGQYLGVPDRNGK